MGQAESLDRVVDLVATFAEVVRLTWDSAVRITEQGWVGRFKEASETQTSSEISCAG